MIDERRPGDPVHAASMPPHPEVHAEAIGSLRAVLGPRLALGLEHREAAMVDFSWISPIIRDGIPASLPTAVARPESVVELRRCIDIAHDSGMPLTMRGKGTTNYGQSVPFAGGLVIEMLGLDEVLDVGDGWIKAQAGATFTKLERAAADTGQELAIHPSTMNSSIGGFVGGGSGGSGSLEHGSSRDGFVRGMTILPYQAGAEAIVLDTPEAALPYVHTWGTTGIFTDLTLRLVPARRWIAVFGAFDTLEDALGAAVEIIGQDPPPRLLAVSEPAILEYYPKTPGLVRDRVNLRALVPEDGVSAVCASIETAGGEVASTTDRGRKLLLSLTNNHSTVRIMRLQDGLCHLPVRAPGLEDRIPFLRGLLDDPMLQFEANGHGGVRAFSCRIMAPYVGPDQIFAAMDEAKRNGLTVREDTHRWRFGGDVDLIRGLTPVVDPSGLLNPGKLPVATAA